MNILNKLCENYKQLKNVNRYTALKYCYQYHKVKINIYFDAYDDQIPTMCLIMHYNKEYYLKTMSLPNIYSGYLAGLPKSILPRLLDANGRLFEFYKSIESCILQNKYKTINCKEDVDILNYSKNIKKQRHKDLRYIHFLRRGNMTNKTFYKARDGINIPEEYLSKIRDSGYTIVCTDDIKKRTTLKVAMQKITK